MRILSVVGARPQFVKAAVVSRVLAERGVPEILVHTGQHYDTNMSQVFFEEMHIPTPQYNLGVGSGSHGDQTGETLKRVERVMLDERPDRVLVYGDTNSTLAGALCAAKLHIPVAHVEAGLRSFNRRMPEEINRVLTDHVSDWLLCPTATAVENLEREGIGRGVHEVGDVMYDAVLFYQPIAARRSSILKDLSLMPQTYYLATIHRAENTDDPRRLGSILEALAQVGRPIVLPLHPRTRRILREQGLETPGTVRLLEPVSYFDMLLLESHAAAIFTDSGGVQKEAFFFHVPCITLRDETEWVETVAAGWNTVVGTDTQRILEASARLTHRPPEEPPLLFGDGRAGEKICKIIEAAV